MRVKLAKSDQVFVVRVWREPHENGTTSCEWRGRVCHVNSRSERHFVGLTALMSALERALGQAADDSAGEPAAETERLT